MKRLFYGRVRELRERLENCISRKEMRQIVQSLDIDLFVSYNTNYLLRFYRKPEGQLPKRITKFCHLHKNL